MFLTCPSVSKVFVVVVLSESHIESLWPSERKIPFILGPAGEVLLITQEKTVQKAHQAAGVLPHVTTQLLESQVLNNRCVVVNQLFRKAMTSNYSSCVLCVFSCGITTLSKLLQLIYNNGGR